MIQRPWSMCMVLVSAHWLAACAGVPILEAAQAGGFTLTRDAGYGVEGFARTSVGVGTALRRGNTFVAGAELYGGYDTVRGTEWGMRLRVGKAFCIAGCTHSVEVLGDVGTPFGGGLFEGPQHQGQVDAGVRFNLVCPLTHREVAEQNASVELIQRGYDIVPFVRAGAAFRNERAPAAEIGFGFALRMRIWSELL